MNEECPIKRTVGVVAAPGKPPPGVLVANDSQIQMQIIKVQDNHHEWINFPYYQTTRVYCKWCLEVRSIEV